MTVKRESVEAEVWTTTDAEGEIRNCSRAKAWVLAHSFFPGDTVQHYVLAPTPREKRRARLEAKVVRAALALTHAIKSDRFSNRYMQDEAVSRATSNVVCAVEAMEKEMGKR
jgi:hypothetical protein